MILSFEWVWKNDAQLSLEVVSKLLLRAGGSLQIVSVERP
jgi:hypothetical protein